MHPGPAGGVAEDDPQRDRGPRHVADRQGRVVGPDRPGADQDGVALGPQAVGVGPGLRAGDPLAGPVGGGDPPVEGGGQLQDHPGPARAAVLQVGRQRCSDLVRPHTPTSTSMPASRSRRSPGRRPAGRGRRCRPPPGARRPRSGRRRTAACGRGGRTARGSRRRSRPRAEAPASSRATASAWGPPGGWVAPSAAGLVARRARSRSPTQGLGEVVGPDALGPGPRPPPSRPRPRSGRHGRRVRGAGSGCSPRRSRAWGATSITACRHSTAPVGEPGRVEDDACDPGCRPRPGTGGPAG